MRKFSLICVLLLVATTRANTVSTAALRDEVNDFLGRELAVHLGAIATLDPPPDRVLGVPTTGEFSWGTFMRSLAAYAETTGKRELAGRDLTRWVAQIGLIESRAGGKAFSQLYAALALRHFGRDLKTNALWQSMTPDEQKAWRSLLNPERFYDPKANKVINLPENYLGVAARIAAIDFDLGISTDRAFLDKLLDRAAIQFTEQGALYADDSPPTGRYDRYSNEYARYVWEAAEMAGRKDILDKLRPSLTAQMRLWWDLVSDDGYGYNWGRSQGVVSYLDTPEIVGFLASHAEFRPAPLGEIAALYYQAWNYLLHDYRPDTHLLSIFAFGRGNYAYITREREWQQTTGFFGKLANSHTPLMNALEKEGVTAFPVTPTLPPVARFEFFRKGQRPAGVWLVRQQGLRFALPITTGPRPGISDYLPAPHGLPGLAAPVEQSYPVVTPYLQLEDGRTVVASDGADVIEPAADGRSLRVRWNRWAVVGSKSGELQDVGLTSEVVWRIENGALVRDETLSSKQPVRIKQWRMVVPSTHDKFEDQKTFRSNKGSLEVQMSSASFNPHSYIVAAGDGPFGRGVHGAIPLHLVFEARDVVVDPQKPLKYKLILREL